jgi:rRNA maturation RNase YbeY
MVKVDVKKLSNYPISTAKIKRVLQDALKKYGLKSDAYVSVAIVGEKKMMELAQTYLKEKNVVHNVLTFASNDTKTAFSYPPSHLMDVGEIIVCYSKAKEEANNEGILVENKVLELIEHGAAHLMGHHHQ